MNELGAFRCWLDDTKLVERSEDDSCCGIELGFEDLKHRNSRGIELQHSASRASGCIVHSLSQFDDVEFVDLVRYRHDLSMLRGRVGSHQSRGCDGDGVMPGDSCRSVAVIDFEVDFNPAGGSKREAIAHHLDRGSECPAGNRLPNLCGIAWGDMEDLLPFRSMSFVSKNPVQLGLRVPSARSTGKGISDSGWPRHATDAKRRRRTRVRRRSILRMDFHTELERVR